MGILRSTTVCVDQRQTHKCQWSCKGNICIFQSKYPFYCNTVGCRDNIIALRYHMMIRNNYLRLWIAEDFWWLLRKKEKWCMLQVEQLTLLLKITSLTTNWSCDLAHVIFNVWHHQGTTDYCFSVLKQQNHSYSYSTALHA